MEYRIQGKTLKDIADSIRSVDPNIQALSPQEMDDEIRRLTAVIDQTYDGESSNPISGKAVKQAIDTLSEKPDYNQNDSTAKDYIKNRPCYTEEVETTLTLLDGTFDFEEAQPGLYGYFQESSFTFEEEKTYTVVFDGTSYNCTCYIINGAIAVLGNSSLFGVPGGNNEPFLMFVADGMVEIGTNLTDASHTVKITTQEITTNIKQLDEKYIPDNVKHVQPDWNQNDSSAKDYIKNRTHYEETINTPVEIYRNISNAGFKWGTSHVGFSGGGNIISTKLSGPRFIEGNRYKFSIRSAGSTPESRPNPIYSQEMDCYKYSDNILCLSSGTSSIDIENSTVSVDSNNGVVIVFYKDTKETIIFANQIGQSSNASIVIDQLSGTYIHQLNEKYLPNEIYTIIDTKMDKINPTGTGSFSLNRKAGTTVGVRSFAEGDNTTASGSYSHAEGSDTTASGTRSHAEGQSTTASGERSHAEGESTTASGYYSHAEGNNTTASGYCSHAEGRGAIASSGSQHAQGKYNIEDSSSTYADIIGNGKNNYVRSNAATVDWSGNAWYAGDVYVGSTSGTNKDAGSKKLATEEYASALGITGATVGQIAKITAVDSNGKPTAWEPVDMPSGEKWELIHTGEVGDKGVSKYVIDYDMDGNPFSLSEFELVYTIYNPNGYSVALGGGMQINNLSKSYFNVNGVASSADCYMGCIGSDPAVVATKGIHNLFIYKGRIVDGFLIMEGFSTGYGYDENDNIASIYGTQGMFSTGKWNDMRSKGAIFQNGVTSFLFQYSYNSFRNANITLRGVRA